MEKSQQPDNDATLFAGMERRSLDEKKRVTVPARWRRSGSLDLCAIPDPRQPLMILLEESEMRRLGAELDGMSDLDPKARRAFKRQFFASAQVCPMDKQGRLVLPADLCEQLKMQKEVVLVGGGNRIEVWAPEKWEAVSTEEQQDFSAVADRIGL